MQSSPNPNLPPNNTMNQQVPSTPQLTSNVSGSTKNSQHPPGPPPPIHISRLITSLFVGFLFLLLLCIAAIILFFTSGGFKLQSIETVMFLISLFTYTSSYVMACFQPANKQEIKEWWDGIKTISKSKFQKKSSNNQVVLTSSKNTMGRRIKWGISILVIIIMCMAGSIPGTYIVRYFNYSSAYSDCGTYTFFQTSEVQHELDNPPGISVSEKDGECIGVSDGRFIFDRAKKGVNAINAKLDAANAQRTGGTHNLESLWEDAVKQNPGDAEALIYQQNLEVQRSSKPYVTFVVVTMLTTGRSNNYASVDVGHNNLKGFFLAQRKGAYQNSFNIRLLIANVGADSIHAERVTGQIQKIAREDKTFMGVLGWPVSTIAGVVKAIKILGDVGIPVISPSATADGLSNISDYFFRVVPPNKAQGVYAARYAKETLKPSKVAVFIASRINNQENPHSKSLATSFMDNFGNDKVIQIPYIRSNSINWTSHLNKVRDEKVDLIYFPNNSDDANQLLSAIQSMKEADNTFEVPKILGGDALYHIRDFPNTGYPSSAKNNVYFTGFIYPGEPTLQNSTMYVEYQIAFIDICKDKKCVPTVDEILSFDTITIAHMSISSLLANRPDELRQHKITREDFKNALKAKKSFKLVSGNVSFCGNDDNDISTYCGSDPYNKSIILMSVDESGNIRKE